MPLFRWVRTASVVFNDYDFLARHARSHQQPAIHHRFAEFICRAVSPRSVIDVGGGTNSFVAALSCETAVADPAARGLDRVGSVTRVLGALPNIPLGRNFEFVALLEVLEHLTPDIFEASLKEVRRLSSRWVLVTSPFCQDLSGAFTVCRACNAVFQAEGHCRSLGLDEVLGLQRYWGGITDLYFMGTPARSPRAYCRIETMKAVVRRLLQRTTKRGFCSPPFTKCPVCGEAQFKDYEKYLRGADKASDYWRWAPGRPAAERFGALFDRNAVPVSSIDAIP